MPPIEKMKNNAQANTATHPVRAAGRVLRRLAMVLVVAFSIGAGLNRLGAALDSGGRPAGFLRGAVQGALMPMAFPNLLFGKDVTIYSANNAGVIYKLGYTAGVNVCGAIFFGFFFWRVNRWRKWAVQQPGSGSGPGRLS